MYALIDESAALCKRKTPPTSAAMDAEKTRSVRGRGGRSRLRRSRGCRDRKL